MQREAQLSVMAQAVSKLFGLYRAPSLCQKPSLSDINTVSFMTCISSRLCHADTMHS